MLNKSQANFNASLYSAEEQQEQPKNSSVNHERELWRWKGKSRRMCALRVW